VGNYLGLAIAVAQDAARLVAALPSVEYGRRRQGPALLLPRLRKRGARSPIRSDPQRVLLRRMIRVLDRLIPGGENCYRRALLEISVDAEAAQRPIHLGLRVPGGPRSGHAWLGDSSQAEAYDAQFDV
jgi:Transglutaminase-like superfamily